MKVIEELGPCAVKVFSTEQEQAVCIARVPEEGSVCAMFRGALLDSLGDLQEKFLLALILLQYFIKIDIGGVIALDLVGFGLCLFLSFGCLFLLLLGLRLRFRGIRLRYSLRTIQTRRKMVIDQAFAILPFWPFWPPSSLRPWPSLPWPWPKGKEPRSV